MMSPFLLKVILWLAMFSVTALAGFSAILLRRKLIKNAEWNKRKCDYILTILSCFAGGVFMGTCFLDIFPHINEHYIYFRHEVGWKFEFPLLEFFVCCGFFIVYFLEELILKIFASSSERKKNLVLAGTSREHPKLSICINKPSCAKNDVAEIASTKNKLELHHYCSSCLDVLTHKAIICKYLNEESKQVDMLKSFTFAFAISFHSILEGFALGVQENSISILTLFISLIIHKSIEAFSVGLQISKSGDSLDSLRFVSALIFAYALMTPLGAIIGDFIINLDIAELPKEGIIIVLEALAGGTFIYVTFLEVLAHERANDHSNLIQLGAILLGFLVITAIQLYKQQATQIHSHDFH